MNKVPSFVQILRGNSFKITLTGSECETGTVWIRIADGEATLPTSTRGWIHDVSLRGVNVIATHDKVIKPIDAVPDIGIIVVGSIALWTCW